MEVTWCGDDAVVLLWKNTGIVMVGPYGDWLNYPYEGSVTVISELDCCRIITSTSCEVLQRVPPSTEAIRRIGSTDPAALLFDAMEGYLEGDPKSDDNIRSIALTNQLQYAVKSCITAASAEFDVIKQQELFRAASYGKAFCQNFDSNEFVETGQRLRVLNDIRRPEIGLPLTIQEYMRLTPEVLVNRLTIRNHHFLALKICDLLKLPNESVLIHWASEKVKKLTETTSTDEEITSLITYKLRPYHRISYLDIATAAYQMGRRKLATMLLELESNASDQVPLLLSMNEVELALQKAMTSDDNDLIYLTLIHLERSEPNSESFYRLLAQYPEALNLLKIYYQHKTTPPPAAGAPAAATAISTSPSTPPMTEGQSFLMSFYQSHRNYYEAALLTLTSAYHVTDQQKKCQLMKDAISIFSQSKDFINYKNYTEEEIDLIDFQKTLELRLSSSPNHHRYDFTNMSLSETLENIYIISVENELDVQRWNQEANKLIKKFKISEKMVWYLRINCYAKFGQWDYLMRLANEKKSPVGYKPFAIACQK
jgi:vacuolar protein sorting-associated protein 16